MPEFVSLATPSVQPAGASGMGAGAAGAPPESPPARRLARPRWRDTRLMVGILLVLVSVVVGAKVVATADRTAAFVVVKTSKPRDAVLVGADLEVRKVRLDRGMAEHYYAGSSLDVLAGMTLVRPVTAGELLSREAVADRTDHPEWTRPTLHVKSESVEALGPGDIVSVYVGVRRGADGSTAANAAENVVLVGSGLEVVSVRDGGALTSVTVKAPPKDAVALAAAGLADRVLVVKTTPDGLGKYSDPGPTTAPGYGP